MGSRSHGRCIAPCGGFRSGRCADSMGTWGGGRTPLRDEKRCCYSEPTPRNVRRGGDRSLTVAALIRSGWPFEQSRERERAETGAPYGANARRHANGYAVSGKVNRMRSKAIRAGRGSIAVGLAAMVLLIARTYVSPSVVVAKEPNAAHNVAAQSAGEMQQLPAPISASQMQVWPGDGVVAGTLPGEPVYSNEIPSIATFFPGSSGAGRRLADDLELAGGACDVAYFDLAVVGLSGAETTFSVNVALWNGDPCAVGSTIILGTEFNVPNIPADGIPKLLSFTVNPVIPIPAKVWLAATFTDPAIPTRIPAWAGSLRSGRKPGLPAISFRTMVQAGADCTGSAVARYHAPLVTAASGPTFAAWFRRRKRVLQRHDVLADDRG